MSMWLIFLCCWTHTHSTQPETGDRYRDAGLLAMCLWWWPAHIGRWWWWCFNGKKKHFRQKPQFQFGKSDQNVNLYRNCMFVQVYSLSCPKPGHYTESKYDWRASVRARRVCTRAHYNMLFVVHLYFISIGLFACNCFEAGGRLNV